MLAGCRGCEHGPLKCLRTQPCHRGGSGSRTTTRRLAVPEPFEKTLAILLPAGEVDKRGIRERPLSLNVNPSHAEPPDDLLVLHVFSAKLQPQRPSHLIWTDADRGGGPGKPPAAKPGCADIREDQERLPYPVEVPQNVDRVPLHQGQRTEHNGNNDSDCPLGQERKNVNLVAVIRHAEPRSTDYRARPGWHMPSSKLIMRPAEARPTLQ